MAETSILNKNIVCFVACDRHGLWSLHISLSGHKSKSESGQIMYIRWSDLCNRENQKAPVVKWILIPPF